VRVAGFDPRVEACGVDGHFHLGFAGVFRNPHSSAGSVERALDAAELQIVGDEDQIGVQRVQIPRPRLRAHPLRLLLLYGHGLLSGHGVNRETDVSMPGATGS